MTQRLAESSPRHAAAVAFGALLTKRMAELEVGQNIVKEAAGVSRASLVEWRHGRNLPTLAVALRVADALREPRLASIVRAGRTLECRRCGHPFLNESGFPKRYCSAACRLLGAPDARSNARAEEGIQLLRQELLRVGPARKQRVGRALTLLDDVMRPSRSAEHALTAYQDAVDAMCTACEPDGLCRTADCPLRGVTTFPLAETDTSARTTAVKPLGRWSRASEHELQSEQLRERWAEPGAKERQAERSRAMWAALSDEERADRTRAMLSGQGRFRTAEAST